MTIPLIHPVDIASVHLENNLALAPLAGTSDLAFRRICRRFGAGLTVTELVSARGISYDPKLKRNWRYLVIDPAEKPVAIQLFGHDPDDFETALRRILLHPLLSQTSMIDLNMGCPVPKVVKGGEGAALMKTPDLAARIVERAVSIASPMGKPVTVKFRKGWDDSQVNAVDFAKRCERAGAAALTIHGRTRAQLYSGRADWQIIRDVKAAVGVPVFGNGDIDSPQAARRMLLETGVDGLMIGRAAQGNPWIFSQILSSLTDDSDLPRTVTPVDKAAVILEHLDSLIDLHGEAMAVREMRKQLAFYLKGTPHGATFKVLAMQAETRADVASVLSDWCN